MNQVERELRDLMDTYHQYQEQLNKEYLDAKKHDDWDGIDTIAVLQRQARIMVAELFKTMKRLGVLDEEEVLYGGIKDK